jgi:hypothetical protein
MFQIVVYRRHCTPNQKCTKDTPAEPVAHIVPWISKPPLPPTNVDYFYNFL